MKRSLRHYTIYAVTLILAIHLRSQEERPPQYILDFQSLISRVDAAWARGNRKEIKKEIGSFLRTQPQDVGALTLDMFAALYFERDWKRAEKNRENIIHLCLSSDQREKVTEVLKEIYNAEEWRKTSLDKELHAKAMAGLHAVFKEKFPASQSANLIEITYYRSRTDSTTTH